MDFTDDHSTGSEDCWSNCPRMRRRWRRQGAHLHHLDRQHVVLEDPKTLGSNDGEHDPSWAPLVYIGRAKGDWLKAKIAAGPTTATVKLNATLTLGTEGGTGYNVMGVIPGRVRNGEKILFVAHHDAFFQGAVDNTTAVVARLVMARAIKMAGYTPRRTIVFLSTTGEEGGQVDHLVRLLLRDQVIGHEDPSELAGQSRRRAQRRMRRQSRRADVPGRQFRPPAPPAEDRRRQPQAGWPRWPYGRLRHRRLRQ